MKDDFGGGEFSFELSEEELAKVERLTGLKGEEAILEFIELMVDEKIELDEKTVHKYIEKMKEF